MGGGDVAPHGTTIVAISYAGGVLLAGDRRATMGNLIASRDVQKVYVTDDYSAAGIAGTAGIAIELVRLFAVELEHYEKIEGVPLTFDGKANRLSSMVRGNLGAAMQGLAVVPLLVGYDLDAVDPSTAGRIVSYDVVGGRYEERAGYHAVGSGSLFAKSALKKLYSPGIDEDTALRFAVEALYDAADDDSATGGPDLTRGGIYPTAVTITSAGAVELSPTRLPRSPGRSSRLARRPRVRKGSLRYDDAVLRIRRTDHARSFGIGAQGNCPRAQRRRSHLPRRSALCRREPVACSAQGQRTVRPSRIRGSGQVQRVRESAPRGHRPRRHAWVLVRSSGRHRAFARQCVRTNPGNDLHRAAQAVRGRDLCCEIGRFGSSTPAQLYRITYDGSIADEQEFVVMGGTTEPIVTAMRESYQRDLDLESAVRIAVGGALQKGGPAPAGTTEAEPRTLDVSALEVAVLDSNRPRRAFKRIAGTVLEEMLPAPAAVEDAPPANGDAPS